MTKLLHVTDFHANRRWFQWVADHADEFDLVAYSGDFLNAFGAEPQASQVRWITAWARALPRPFVWAMGNHDVADVAATVPTAPWMTALPGAKYWLS